MARFKLGRRTPLWSPRHMRAAYRTQASFDALGTPPAESADFVSAVTALVGNRLGMFLNDSLGCCTASDCGHALMIRTANTGTWLMPKDADILQVYEATGGYVPGNSATDQGADEGAVCAYMRDVGLLGHRSVGTAPIAVAAVDEAACDRIRWTIQLFGACRLGLNLPEVASAQFDAGDPWAWTPDMAVEGGHDVPALKYDPTGVWVATWGGNTHRPDGLQLLTWESLKLRGEEAHAEIFPDFLMSTGLTPEGFNLASLTADLAELAA